VAHRSDHGGYPDAAYACRSRLAGFRRADCRLRPVDAGAIGLFRLDSGLERDLCRRHPWRGQFCDRSRPVRDRGKAACRPRTRTRQRDSWLRGRRSADRGPGHAVAVHRHGPPSPEWRAATAAGAADHDHRQESEEIEGCDRPQQHRPRRKTTDHGSIRLKPKKGALPTCQRPNSGLS
jgi:hypothetical protein